MNTCAHKLSWSNGRPRLLSIADGLDRTESIMEDLLPDTHIYVRLALLSILCGGDGNIVTWTGNNGFRPNAPNGARAKILDSGAVGITSYYTTYAGRYPSGTQSKYRVVSAQYFEAMRILFKSQVTII